ncbi:hypothetical protein [Streptomyces sp. NPDC008125]|uniref:hypothetical protein n=1 Tax=Streptomyces sp. NPDC008125 TaxID=3364811 RepID=UPI0036E2C623
MSDAAPHPVHLDALVNGLASNPALPPGEFHRFLGHRRGRREIAGRPDLTDDLADAIVAVGDVRLTRALARNRALPHAYRTTLGGHPDPWIRLAVAVAVADAPREPFERLLVDSDPEVRERGAQTRKYGGSSRHIPNSPRRFVTSSPRTPARSCGVASSPGPA